MSMLDVLKVSLKISLM